jgi:hypothetical protein
MDWEQNLTGVEKLFGSGAPGAAGAHGAAAAATPPTTNPAGTPPRLTAATAPATTPAATASTTTTSATRTAPLDTAARVNSFLAKAHDKAVQDVKMRLGDDVILYDAISAANKRATTAHNLLGGDPVPVGGLRTLAELGDGRIMSGGLQLAISAKKIVCASVDSNWRCLCCEPHAHEEAFKIRGVANSACNRQVVVISDQSFPACLPTSGQQDCIKIIIVKNCSLDDGVKEFLRRLGNRRVPPRLGAATLLSFSSGQCWPGPVYCRSA